MKAQVVTGREFFKTTDPSHDFDIFASKGRLQVFNLMRPHDEDRARRKIALFRPTLRCRMFDGGIL